MRLRSFQWGILLFALSATSAHAVGVANDMPGPKPEEASGCADTAGKSLDQLADQACGAYRALEKEFGKNSWTDVEGGKCRTFYNVAFRIRNVICNYKKADDQIAPKIQAAAGSVNDQQNAESSYATEMGNAKSMHQKYGELLFGERVWLAGAYKEFANELKLNNGVVPPRSLRDEARCSGAQGHGGDSGVNETSFLVPAAIKLQADHLQQLFPKLREALNSAIGYSEAMTKGYGDPSAAAAGHSTGLGDASAITGGLAGAGKISLDGEKSAGPTTAPGSSGAATTLVKEPAVDRAIVRNLEHAELRSAGLVGAILSLSIDIMITKQLPSAGSVAASAVGIASFGVGLAASVVVAMAENEQQMEAYYRYWATNEAPANLNPIRNVKVKARDISNAFCQHMEDEKRKAEEEQRAEMQQRADQVKSQVERQQLMMQDQQIIRNAPRDQQQGLIRQYCSKWQLTGGACGP